MTEKEVFDILGPPTEVWTGGLSPNHYVWAQSEQTITVSVSTMWPDDGTVVEKNFFPRSLPERIRDYWRHLRAILAMHG
jgi:hypothetical protein